MLKREEKLIQIIQWSENNNNIRALLQTSSLVNPHAPIDEFSDLDIEIVVEDLDQFLTNDDWILLFGSYISKIVEGTECFSGLHAMRMVLYKDHVKVDYKIWSVSNFKEMVTSKKVYEDWDIGYKVLLDKDQLTVNMKPPSYEYFFIQKPDENKFNQILNDFWWDTTYVAKCLARDEIFYAKFMTENVIRTDYIIPVTEWLIAENNGWNLSTNKHGRLFKKYLSENNWIQLEATFSGASLADNWRALFAMCDWISESGKHLAAKWVYRYPTHIEDEVRQYLLEIKMRNQKDQ